MLCQKHSTRIFPTISIFFGKIYFNQYAAELFDQFFIHSKMQLLLTQFTALHKEQIALCMKNRLVRDKHQCHKLSLRGGNVRADK